MVPAPRIAILLMRFISEPQQESLTAAGRREQEHCRFPSAN
jgi:hypothetical protein